MSTLRIIVFLVLSTFTCKIGFSQIGLYEYTDSAIKAIKSQVIEPIIVIGPEKYPGIIMRVELSKHPDAIIWESYYYLYRIADNNYLTKCIEIVTCGNEPKVFLKSEPVKIDNDSLFIWLKTNDSALSRDRILPFIYKDTSNGIESYDVGFRMHSFPYSMTIQDNGRFISYSFEEIAMQESLIEGLPNFQPNLNYLHNSRTAIFELYYKLQHILDLHRDSFKFIE